MTPFRKASFALAVAVAGSLAAAHPAAAQTTAFTFNSAPTRSFTGTYTWGYQFTVTGSPIVVTSLGYYTPGLATTNLSHEVSIFSGVKTAAGTYGGGTSVADTFVSTAAALTNGSTDTYFTYVQLATPVTLQSGVYEILGNSNGGTAATYVSTNAASGLSLGFDRFMAGTPTLSGNEPAGIGSIGTTGSFFGPNFQFTAAPEPSQTAALGIGALGIVGLALRARRRREAQS